MKVRRIFDPVFLILFCFSCINGMLKNSVKPLRVGVKNPNSSELFLPWQSKGKFTGCCCLLVLLNSLVQSFHLPCVTREASVVCSLKHTYFSLRFCWFYPDSVGRFVHPSDRLIFQFHYLTRYCWYPPLKESVFNEEKEGIRQKMTAKTDHNLSKSQGTLTMHDFSSRKHRNRRVLGQWARGKLWNTLSLLWQQRMTVCSTCVWVFIHHFPWKVSCSRVGGGLFWVGCG